ncbi:MAG TPA: ATP-binding protein [Polyangia bacterium]
MSASIDSQSSEHPTLATESSTPETSGDVARPDDLPAEIASLRRTIAAREEVIRKQAAQIKRQQWLMDERARESAAALEKLRETTGFLREIHRTMPGALLAFDRQGLIQVANESALTLLGYTEAELLGRPVSVIFEERDAPSMAEVELQIPPRGVLRSERVCRSKSGQRIPVLFSVSAYGKSIESGLARGVVCVALDLRERKRLESELNLALKLESVGRLAAGVAHEINTPIQFVSDSVHFVRDAVNDLARLITKYQALHAQVLEGQAAPELAAEISEAVEDADLSYLLENLPPAIERSLEGLDRVTTIVRSMKDFAHPDQKEMAAVDLNRCVSSTLTIARNELKYVADLETHLGELPPVVCHAGDINQVILNLVVNAAHAIGDVVKGTEGKGRITVTTRVEGAEAVIAIGDTGGGIPAHIRDHVFDPFFTTKEVGRGTGQGLSIGRKIVDRHKGQLTFETELGVGTTFFIRLPIGPS